MRLKLENNVRHSHRVQVIAEYEMHNKTIFGTDLYNFVFAYIIDTLLHPHPLREKKKIIKKERL